MSRLSAENIEHFRKEGYVVIEDWVKNVDEIRKKYHKELVKYDINHEEIINGLVEPPSGIRVRQKSAYIFYAKFKMDLHINNIMYETWKHLINECIDEFPFGPHDDVIPYIDRTCYRLPDHIRHEGGLGLHLDRRPGKDNLHNSNKYRPIQGFIALTDHYGTTSGGLQLVPGFHKLFNNFFPSEVCHKETKGDFFRMNDKTYSKIHKQLITLNVPAGSLVLWDSRIPHSTCNKFEGFDSREVIYMSYIPNVPLNIQYHNKQCQNYEANIPPPEYNDGTSCDKDNNLDIFQSTIMNIPK